MGKDITNYITVDDVDLELFICTEILKLQSLHFGYWEGAEELSLANVRHAQARYTGQLIAHLPAGVRTVLDVGCGIGDNARALAASGYAVTALSPDGNHGKYLAGDPSIRFHQARFEDFATSDRFDLVLMSESQNYFDADFALARTRALLQENGCLLICGMFRQRPTPVFPHVRNVESEFLARAAQHGFSLETHTDITERVIPTMQYAETAYRDYVAPSLALIARYSSHAAPWKMRLIKFFLRRQLRDFETIQRYYQEFFTPSLFREHVRYLTLLFRAGQPSSS